MPSLPIDQPLSSPPAPRGAAGPPRPAQRGPEYARENNFDLLRGFLAYAVLVYHTGYLTYNDRLTPESLAGVAVGGFFVISGFLLTWSLERKPDLWGFAVRRFFRIYPLYALVILVQAAILVAEIGSWRPGLGAELLRYLGANLIFANFIQPTIGDTLSGLRLDAINGSAWTLKVEIACYVALPFVLALQRRLGPGLVVVLAVLLALYPSITGAPRGSHASVYLGLASFFFIGSLLYRWGPRLYPWRSWFLPVGLIGAPVVVLGSPWIMDVPVGAQILVALWIYCAAFASRTIHLKDDVSYGAYLLHFPVIQLGLLHGIFTGHVLVTLLWCLPWSRRWPGSASGRWRSR